MASRSCVLLTRLSGETLLFHPSERKKSFHLVAFVWHLAQPLRNSWRKEDRRIVVHLFVEPNRRCCTYASRFFLDAAQPKTGLSTCGVTSPVLLLMCLRELLLHRALSLLRLGTRGRHLYFIFVLHSSGICLSSHFAVAFEKRIVELRCSS